MRQDKRDGLSILIEIVNCTIVANVFLYFAYSLWRFDTFNIFLWPEHAIPGMIIGAFIGCALIYWLMGKTGRR